MLVYLEKENVEWSNHEIDTLVPAERIFLEFGAIRTPEDAKSFLERYGPFTFEQWIEELEDRHKRNNCYSVRRHSRISEGNSENRENTSK